MPPSPSPAPPTLPPHLTTYTHLLSPLSLNHSPHLPALFTLINHCFNISHNPPGHSYLPYSPTTRLKTHTQLSEEIGPDGFTIIMLAHDTSTSTSNQIHSSSSSSSSSSPETVIATASAKPYIPPLPNKNNENHGQEEQDTATVKLFKRQPGTDNALAAYGHLPKWEILCMVVEPTLQGRGIAGQLMGLTIEEIKRRVREGGDEAKYDQGNGKGEEGNGEGQEEGGGGDGKGENRKGKNGEVLLMLSSLQELNEGYYKKRGWETSGVRRFPRGTMGSAEGFGVVEMMRVVPLY